MDKIENLPFYDTYMLLVEGKRVAEKEIVELENPEKQLERIKKFYQNIGAVYTRNQWVVETESNISEMNSDEDSRLNQLQRTVRLGSIVENAVLKQDDESLKALNAYSSNESYSDLVRQIMFYVGVCKVEKDPEFIEKAGKAIMKRYSPYEATIFANEGVNYYIFYLQCLKKCLAHYRGDSQYEHVKDMVSDRCMNLKLMLSHFQDDPYIDHNVKSILAEISDIEELMREGTDEIIA